MIEGFKPPLVRAWFDTVLNPLIRSLMTEAAALARRDLTWRAHSQSFASLVPVRSHLSGNVWDNLDQFLSVHPKLSQQASEHDNRLQVLCESVLEYRDALIANPEFRLLSQGLDGNNADGAQARVLAAEYVINQIQRLPNYYSTSVLWNQRAEEFLRLRQSPDISAKWENVQKAIADFGSALDNLTQALLAIRNTLSFESGEPIVRS